MNESPKYLELYDENNLNNFYMYGKRNQEANAAN